METKIEEIGSCKKKLIIEISVEEIKAELNSEFKKIQENVVMPGFRKGKAPRQMLEKRFKAQIEGEVKQSIIGTAYQNAIKEHNLTPMGSPEFGEAEFDFDAPFTFEVTLETKPEFELSDYKGIEVKKNVDTEVTDEIINAELKKLSLGSSTLTTVENGEIENGDFVICDVKVEVDGTVVDEDEEVQFNSSETTIAGINVPDLSKSLLGSKSDDEVSIDVKLDNNFKVKEHHDKEATLKLLIKEIKRSIPSEINDELAKKFNCEDLEELKDRLESSLEMQLKDSSTQDINNQIIQKLLETTKIDLPVGVISSVANAQVEKYATQLMQKGTPLDKVNEAAEQVRGNSEESVANEFKVSLILEYIADKEKIYVTESEVQKRIEMFARSYNYTYERMEKELEKVGNIRSMRQQMRDDKTFAFLRENMKIISNEPANKAAANKDENDNSTY